MSKNPIVHIEFAGRAGEKLETFYASLFDWSVKRDKVEGYPYGRIDFGAIDEITGGIRHEPEGKAELVVYVQVEDLNVTIERAQALGASVRIPPMETPDVTFALIGDPEGNPVGLIQKSK